MKRLLLPLLAALALPTAVNANVDPEVHKLCLPAADYLGCVKAMTTQSSDIPSMRVIEGRRELTGNSCPAGYGYIGAGMCRQIKCKDRFVSHVDLKGKGWKCGAWFKPYWAESSVKAVVDEYCPNEEPIIGRQSSCETLEPKVKKI